MKTKLFLFALTLIFGIAGNSCNAQNRIPNQQVVNAFKAKYPRARHTEWENKQGFHIAEFYDWTAECEAWFDGKGNWMLTKSELAYEMLPAAIQSHIGQSIYGNWKKDDVTKIERPDATPIYIVEVEQGKQETDLYYTENGQLLKSLKDLTPGTPADYFPVPADILHQITQKYPHAIVIDSERDKGKYEIEILDQGQKKEVTFNGTTWEYTRWEVKPADLPAAVATTLRQSAYANHRIDEIRFIETPANAYYRIELDHEPHDIYLSIDPQGNLLK